MTLLLKELLVLRAMEVGVNRDWESLPDGLGALVLTGVGQRLTASRQDDVLCRPKEPQYLSTLAQWTALATG